MIPDIESLRGKLVEMHGSPDAETTKQMAEYISDMQRQHDSLTCYYGSRGGLAKTVEDGKFFDQVWVVPTLSGGTAQESLMFATSYVDLVVIDDITYISENLSRFFDSLRTLARKNKLCIFLLNQRRFVKNRVTGVFEDMPYRYDVVQKYCAMSIDADTKETVLLQKEELEYDSFVKFLLNEDCS